ncbi:hypothetical protein [Tateyamaria sp.]|uniref:hypothetical protein n=1 Tax=Tateyamaria sp. TaxID=1929288 RepID=UPI003293C66A
MSAEHNFDAREISQNQSKLVYATYHEIDGYEERFNGRIALETALPHMTTLMPYYRPTYPYVYGPLIDTAYRLPRDGT